MTAGVVAWVTSALLAFHAGCVGDTKGGSLGDPVAALRVESIGIGLLCFGCALLAASASTSPDVSVSKRIAAAAGIFLVAFVVGEFCTFQGEIWGVQYCYRRLAP
jgi:hypothetical protein